MHQASSEACFFEAGAHASPFGPFINGKAQRSMSRQHNWPCRIRPFLAASGIVTRYAVQSLGTQLSRLIALEPPFWLVVRASARMMPAQAAPRGAHPELKPLHMAPGPPPGAKGSRRNCDLRRQLRLRNLRTQLVAPAIQHFLVPSKMRHTLPRHLVQRRGSMTSRHRDFPSMLGTKLLSHFPKEMHQMARTQSPHHLHSRTVADLLGQRE